MALFGRSLILLLALSAGACASAGGAKPRPFPGAALPPSGPAVGAPAADASPAAAPQVVNTALALRGVPYRNGGSDPTGFDCSGFVQWVFSRNGVTLPREVKDQYGEGRSIGRREIRPGDLVFFQTVSRGASHVGVAISDDEFVHAPSSRGVVRVERLSAEYWDRRFVGARRIPAVRATD
jgi:cell wall-associated NlpC family hydrolase